MQIHPITVHFPIAFYILECFLLGLYAVKHEEEYKRFAFLAFRLAYVLGLVAMIAGLNDAGGLSGIKGKVVPHVVSAAVLFVISTIRGVYWRMGKTQPRYALVLLLSSLFAVLAVTLTGFFGGELVYE